MQVNINRIKHKLEELTLLFHDTHTDSITIQETKLTPKTNTPKVHYFTTVRTDNLHKAGGGLITLIRDNITFTITDIHSTINTHRFQAQSVKFIANYIKGCKTYATYRNRTSPQRQFKTGFPQGGVLSPTLFNIYTADIPPPRALAQVMAYADGITIKSTHTSTSAAKKYIQPYIHIFAWTTQNNLTLNPDKTASTMFTPNPTECKCNVELIINNAPKGSEPYLRPKTYIHQPHSQHLSTSTHATANDKSTHTNKMG